MVSSTSSNLWTWELSKDPSLDTISLHYCSNLKWNKRKVETESVERNEKVLKL